MRFFANSARLAKQSRRTALLSMNFFSYFHLLIEKIILEKGTSFSWPKALDLSKLTLEAPKRSSHGDIATNAVLILSKQVGEKNAEVAQKLLSILPSIFPKGTQLDVAGPGFINITLPTHFWQNHLKLIVENPGNYGPTLYGKGRKVHIEFVSANPTGPLHTGHSRNAVVGDTIASILEAVGYEVHREYYINDAGGQVDALARSVYLRYQQFFGVDIPESAFEGLYPGDYVIDIGQKLMDEKGDSYLDKPESQWLPDVRLFAVAEAMKGIKRDLADLGVVMDTYTSEADIAKAGKIDDVLRLLEEQEDVYIGVIEPPKGQVVEDYEPRPHTLFRSTKYGDTIDRPLKKSDGSWSYFAPDIAYHRDKIQRGYSDLIDILGVDHVGYFSRIAAAVKAVSDGAASLQICNYNVVNFLENGVPVKMSKRAGNFITLNDLLEKVGKDTVRFMMLTRHHNSVIDFDFAKVLEKSKDNPIFYVQYAHARICSVMRHAETLWEDLDVSIARADVSTLSDPAELGLIKILAQYPKIIEVAAHLHEPHRVAYYLYDVASCFHSLWNKGKENARLRFIDESEREGSLARLTLLKATQQIIAAGLKIYKIDPVQEMR